VSAGTALSSTGGTTPTLSLDNTAVTTGTYTNATLTVDQQGRLTFADNGTAPVTAVTASGGISSSGGTTPNIALENTTVTANTYANASITVDAQGRLTFACANPDPLACSLITAKGDLLVGTAASTATALGVGADTYVLTANSACAGGIEWATAPPPAGTVADADYTAKGDILVASAASTPTALSVGTNGQVLVANSACTTGTEWATISSSWTCATEVAVDCGGGAGSYLVHGYTSDPSMDSACTAFGNCVLYRQTAAKTYEVVWVVRKCLSGGTTDGSGQYIFEIPSALPNIDTALFNQTCNQNVCNTASGSGSQECAYWVCPGMSLAGSGALCGNNRSGYVVPSVWDDRCVRFLVAGCSGCSLNWSHAGGWYGLAGQTQVYWMFGMTYQGVS
jgi:hypothetical protein